MWDGVQSLPKWPLSHHVCSDRDESRNYGVQISPPIPVPAPVSPAPACSGRSSAEWRADAVVMSLAWEPTPAVPAWEAGSPSIWDESWKPSPAALWDRVI